MLFFANILNWSKTCSKKEVMLSLEGRKSAMPVADSGMETRVMVAPTLCLKQGQVLDFSVICLN